SAMASAASFRLDQVLMDALVRGSEADRAVIFLKAFFPEDRPLFDKLRTANQAAANALQALPKPLVEATATVTDRISWAVENLAWTAQPPASWPAPFLEVVRGCLSLTPEQLDLMGQLSGSMQPVVANLRKPARSLRSTEEELGTLDE